VNVSERELIPAGIRIHVIKSPRGSYVRTPDGKFFAIRQSMSTTVDNARPVPIISHQSPLPPPPPPPPPSSSSLLDDLLYGMINKIKNLLLKFKGFLDPSPPPPSFSSLMNDLNDEIDLLISDINSNQSQPPPPPPTSTLFENFDSWHDDYYQQNDFYPDLFPNQSNMSVTSSNNNNNSIHEFTSNSLTFI